MKLLKCCLIFVLMVVLVQGYVQSGIIPSPQVPMKIASVSSHIVGGSNAAVGAFPWQVALIIVKPLNSNANVTSLCGGSLIDKQWVLAAGHCTKNAIAMLVRLGSVKLTTGGTSIQSSASYTHPNYTASPVTNDVGLVKLSSPAVLSDTVKLIKLASAAITNAATTLTISGWGKNCTACDTAEMLQYASVKAISNTQCASTYGVLAILPSTICTLATTSANQSLCFGDSGGPLVQTGTTNYLVGVASFIAEGNNSCDRASKVPNGFMRAASFCSWIQSFITGFDC